ncbi:MAG: site-specific integrase [Acidobacteria bacterium]|nr:site-specific integrase [Acidobacteriota bacterium]
MTETIEQEKSAPKSRKSGQVIKRGENKWLVRMFTGSSDVTGKKNYFSKTIHGTRQDAQKFLNAKLRERDLGIFIEPATESVSAYLDKWLLTAAKPKLKQQTYDSYSSLLDRYIRTPLGGIKLGNLRALDIQNVYTDMLQRKLSARVIRYTHAVFSSALKQAVQWGMLHVNPASLVQLPKSSRQEMRVLDQTEVSKFLTALQNDRYETAFSFAIASGMRPEEWMSLQWKDVDFDRATATVQRALVRLKGGDWKFDETKTSKSRRTITLPPSTVSQLRSHRARQLEERLKLGSDYQDFGLVFATEIGTPLSIHNITNRHFKPALVRAGLPKIRLYDATRHTHATLLLLAGENPKVVSERLGHSSVILTLDVYSHVLPSMQAAVAQKLEKLVFG